MASAIKDLLNGLHDIAFISPVSTVMHLGGSSGFAVSNTKSRVPAPRTNRVHACGWKRAVVTGTEGGRRSTIGAVFFRAMLCMCTSEEVTDAMRLTLFERAMAVTGVSCETIICAARARAGLSIWIVVLVVYTRASVVAKRWDMRDAAV